MFLGFDFEVIWRSLPFLLFDGLGFTLRLTTVAALGGIALGTLLAFMRLSKFRAVSLFAAGYVNLLRALPLVLVIFWFYFLIPWAWQWIISAERPVPIGAFQSAVITFILFEAAYYSEIMRAGIQSVGRGQFFAGQALGLRRYQVFIYIVLPQAFRNMLPVLLTQAIILFQDTSLVYVLSLNDFLGAASKIANRDYRLTEMYVFAAVVYLAISLALSGLVRVLKTRVSATEG